MRDLHPPELHLNMKYGQDVRVVFKDETSGRIWEFDLYPTEDGNLGITVYDPQSKACYEDTRCRDISVSPKLAVWYC